jgi:hypothetical protein
VGHEAGCAGGVPRRVQADPDRGDRPANQRTPSATRQTGKGSLPHPLHDARRRQPSHRHAPLAHRQARARRADRGRLAELRRRALQTRPRERAAAPVRVHDAGGARARWRAAFRRREPWPGRGDARAALQPDAHRCGRFTPGLSRWRVRACSRDSVGPRGRSARIAQVPRFAGEAIPEARRSRSDGFALRTGLLAAQLAGCGPRLRPEAGADGTG